MNVINNKKNDQNNIDNNDDNNGNNSNNNNNNNNKNYKNKNKNEETPMEGDREDLESEGPSSVRTITPTSTAELNEERENLRKEK